MAIGFAVLMVAALVARFWAADREYAVTGPSHVTASDAGVFVHVSDDILQLSPTGSVLAGHGAESTGLDDVPIDLRLAHDGRLLVATQRPAAIRVCDTQNWACETVGETALSAIARQFKLLPEGDSWLLSDARGDALWFLDRDSGELREALPAKTLAGPNGMTRDDEGHVWVADTDNRRIVELIPTGEGRFVAGREHSTVNEHTVGERFYPMMLEFAADGRLWVIQATDFSMAEADLVIYDPEVGAEAVVPLGEGAYPTGLAVLAGSLLVTDMERFRIDRVDTRTRSVEPFGGAALAERLGWYRAERQGYARLSALALVATVAFAVAMIVLAMKATPKEGRWTKVPSFDPDKAAESVPETKTVHWLQRNTKIRWLLYLDRVYYLLFGLLCLCCLLIYAWACRQPWWPEGAGLAPADQLGITLLLACLAVAAFIPMMHQSARVLRRRVGTDGRRVHFELEDGRRIACEPGDLFYNSRAVLYRAYAFPLNSNRKYALYAEGEVDRWLAPMLRGANRLSEWQTIRHQWKNRDLQLLYAVAAMVVLGILIVVIKATLPA